MATSPTDPRSPPAPGAREPAVERTARILLPFASMVLLLAAGLYLVGLNAVGLDTGEVVTWPLGIACLVFSGTLLFVGLGQITPELPLERKVWTLTGFTAVIVALCLILLLT